MAKRVFSVFAVTTADWLRYRPYKQFSPQYDGYYLRLSNRVFETLNASSLLRGILAREHTVELAVVLASWFEDYANEIGLWATFVRKNKELHGYELPFYNLDDYDPDDMNPEDIAYLVWHFCCTATNKIFGPDNSDLLKMADALLETFDEALDEAPGTDFYDDFLHIAPDVYFFNLKSKLYWLAFQCYLTAPEMRREMDEAVRKLLEEKNELLRAYDDPNKLIYTMQDDYLYKKCSSFLAFTLPDWLAEVARCPDDSLHDDIRKLSRRVLGEFVYEADEGDYYKFRYLHTKRLFLVQQESVTLKGISPGELVLTSIVEWRGEWWVTGTIASLGNAEFALKNMNIKFDPSTVSFYGWPEEQQQALRDIAANMEAAYLEYFGAPMVFFQNEKDLHAAFQDANDFYNGKLNMRGAPKPEARDFLTSPSKLNNGTGIAIFIEPGVGAVISPLLAEVAYLLEKPELTRSEAASLFFDLFKECSSACAQYMLEHFSLRNLHFPVITNLSPLAYPEYLMRFYNPDSFREKIPINTFMPS